MKFKIGDKVKFTDSYKDNHPQDDDLEEITTIIEYDNDGSGLFGRMFQQWPYTILFDDGEYGLAAEDEIELV